MDAFRFDRLTRGLSATPTRRGMLIGLTTALGLAASRIPGAAKATKKNRKKKKLKFNQFGCVSVEGKCRGKNIVCCSGICQGKKPKPGEKDKSKCVAHHVGVCTPAVDKCMGNPGAACNPDLPFSWCYRTTGKASFCGNASVGGCISCRKDAECEAKGFGQGAACVVCPNCAGGEGTACISPGTA